MKNRVIAIPSQYVVITTLVYAFLAPIFFEMDNNVFGKQGENFVVTDKTMMMYSQPLQQQLVDTKECKSPCPESAEMCIQMCA